VYNELGYGFLEAVYENGMGVALKQVGLTIDRQYPVPVRFRGEVIGSYYADLMVNRAVLLELKTARALEKSHESQLLHYLRATDIEVGLLLNFGSRPQFRRLLFDNERKKIRENPCESVAEVLS
jgi:GxxExxY protein